MIAIIIQKFYKNYVSIILFFLIYYINFRFDRKGKGMMCNRMHYKSPWTGLEMWAGKFSAKMKLSLFGQF